MDCSTSGFPVLHYLPKFRQGQGPLRVSSSQEWTCLCILVVLSHRLGVTCGKGSLSRELLLGDSESEVWDVTQLLSPGEGKGCPLQYSGLENSMDYIVHGVTKSHNWATCTFTFSKRECEQPTHWKSPLCWERLRAEGEEGVRGWDDWMTSPMKWTWTWANFGRWWGAGSPGMLQSMGSQRVR